MTWKPKGFWNIVSSIEEVPGGNRAVGTTTFDRRKDIALTNLVPSIDDSGLGSVTWMENVNELRMRLRELYQTVSRSSIDAMIEQYQQVRISHNESITAYVNRLPVLETKLRGMGHSLNAEEDQITLLRGLRSEFGVTADIIRGMNKLVAKERTLSTESEPTFEPVMQTSHAWRKGLCHHC